MAVWGHPWGAPLDDVCLLCQFHEWITISLRTFSWTPFSKTLFECSEICLNSLIQERHLGSFLLKKVLHGIMKYFISRVVRTCVDHIWREECIFVKMTYFLFWESTQIYIIQFDFKITLPTQRVEPFNLLKYLSSRSRFCFPLFELRHKKVHISYLL